MDNILLRLFGVFFNIGAFTLGGGYAMLALVEKTIVEKHKYISEKDFWDMITIVQTLPGVFAVNTALYVGYRVKGLRGAFASMLGAVLPSLLIILVVAIFFANIWQSEIGKAIFWGIRPCVVALILAPSVKMAKSIGMDIRLAWIPVFAVIAVCIFFVSPVYVLMLFGFGGLLWHVVSYKILKKGGDLC